MKKKILAASMLALLSFVTYAVVALAQGQSVMNIQAAYSSGSLVFTNASTGAAVLTIAPTAITCGSGVSLAAGSATITSLTGTTTTAPTLNATTATITTLTGTTTTAPTLNSTTATIGTATVTDLTGTTTTAPTLNSTTAIITGATITNGTVTNLTLGATPITSTGTELNQYAVNASFNDAGNAGSVFVVVPHAGTISEIAVVNNAASTTTKTIFTGAIAGTPITHPACEIALAATAGTKTAVAPSAANVVAAGDVIEIASDGGTDAVMPVTVTLKITR